MSDEPSGVNSPNPAPEMLEVRKESTEETPQTKPSVTVEAKSEKQRIAYRPSHKGTLIGILAIVIVLLINVAVVFFIVRKDEAEEAAESRQSVTISDSVLSGLGVSRNPVGGEDTLLTIGPNTVLSNDVTIGGDTTMSGSLTLNSTFTAPNANFTNLQSGDTQVQQINVNGDGTVTNLNVRQDLVVAGTTRVQGQLTVNQLTTLNNNVTIAGNLAIGGSLSVRIFQVGQLTVSGHLISTGSAPTVSAGSAVGSNGTVSISGNDTAGTVAVNTGVGAGNGMLAQISFREQYGSTPHVLVTPVGRPVPGLYVNRSATGFSISVDGALPPSGHAFDYMIVQ